MEDELFEACLTGSIDKLQRVLRNDPGVDINWINNSSGLNSLMAACKGGHHVVIQTLLSIPKIEVNQRKSDGVTPFLLACYHGRLEVVKKLLQDDRVEINLGDKDNCTPIWNAACNGHYDVIKWMIASGRGLELEKKGKDVFGDKKEYSPGEIARKEKRNEIAELMERVRKEPVEVRRELRSELGIKETPLEILLRTPLSSFASAFPENPSSLSEITSLSLADSALIRLPPQLATLTTLQSLDLSLNPLASECGAEIAKIIRNNPNLRTLDLHQVPLNATGSHAVLVALVEVLTQKKHYLENLRMQDCLLDNFQGLEIIPADILQLGVEKVIGYLTDLFASLDSVPTYKSKLMIVGSEGVNKTEILDCLFPLTGWLQTQGKFKKTWYWFKLQGNEITKYDNPGDATPHKGRATVLDKVNWELVIQDELGIKLRRRGETVLDLTCSSKEIHTAWVTRLQRLVTKDPFETLRPQMIIPAHPVLQEYFAEKKEWRLQFDVWNYSAEHEYNHYPLTFLPIRTVFLVAWSLSDGEQGLRGLESWFRVLASRLSPSTLTRKLSGSYFSVLVVGLYDDAFSQTKTKNVRAMQVDQLAVVADLKVPFQYMELSASVSEDMELIQDSLIRTTLNHLHMGERVPAVYLSVLEDLRKERGKKKVVPFWDLKELVAKYEDEALVKRALCLLSLWGECMYFPAPPELAGFVILEPKFLTKDILADFFQHDPNSQRMRKDGIVRHSDLVHIWSRFRSSQRTAEDFISLVTRFLKLLQQLEITFVCPEGEGDEGAKKKPFMEKKSIVPALLPERADDPETPTSTEPAPSAFSKAWSEFAPSDKPAQLERIFTLASVPAELVSRLWFRLHPYLPDTDLLWKNDAIIFAKEPESCHAWISVDQQMSIVVMRARGSEMRDCVKLLEVVASQLKKILEERYSSMKWAEKTLSRTVGRLLSRDSNGSQDPPDLFSMAISRKNGPSPLLEAKNFEKLPFQEQLKLLRTENHRLKEENRQQANRFREQSVEIESLKLEIDELQK